MFALVGDKAGFEVSPQRALRADASAGEIGGADEGFLSVHDDRLGVDAGAENALEKFAVDERGIAVKVLPESRAGFLGVEESDRDPVVDHVGENFEEGNKAATFFNVEILEIGGDDPEEFFGPGEHFDNHPLVDVFIENEVGHIASLAKERRNRQLALIGSL